MISGYESLRNEFMQKLTDNISDMSITTLKEILSILDGVSVSYAVQQQTTALSIPNGELPELVKIYIASKTVEGLSSLTLKNILAHIRAFVNMTHKPFEDVSSNDIRMFLFNYQKERNIANQSLNKVRSDVCGFFHWIAAEKYIPSDPAITIKPIKFEEKQRLSLSQIELEYIRKACRDLRDKAIVEFLYSTGCRVSELANVKISDVNFLSDEVTLFGKGKKYRTSYLNAKAHVTIQEYLSTRNDDCPYLIVSQRKPTHKIGKENFEKLVRELRQRASEISKPVTPHIFRHTTATQAVANGMLVEEVQKLLGHKNIATTMIYVETMKRDVHSSHRKSVI